MNTMSKHGRGVVWIDPVTDHDIGGVREYLSCDVCNIVGVIVDYSGLSCKLVEQDGNGILRCVSFFFLKVFIFFNTGILFIVVN